VSAWTTPAPPDRPPVDEPTPPAARDVTSATFPMDPTINLTARELQVVALLCDGYTQKQIAPMLEISLTQVGRLISKAMTRTGARNATQLAALAVTARLVTPTTPSSTGI
jgi:DNA-binding NarL/FixJ family response regulator